MFVFVFRSRLDSFRSVFFGCFRSVILVILFRAVLFFSVIASILFWGFFYLACVVVVVLGERRGMVESGVRSREGRRERIFVLEFFDGVNVVLYFWLYRFEVIDNFNYWDYGIKLRFLKEVFRGDVLEVYRVFSF